MSINEDTMQIDTPIETNQTPLMQSEPVNGKSRVSVNKVDEHTR